MALLFMLSQTVALFTTHVESLWIVSTLLGLAYGCLFNVLPMLVLEWFGMGELLYSSGIKIIPDFHSTLQSGKSKSLVRKNFY